MSNVEQVEGAGQAYLTKVSKAYVFKQCVLGAGQSDLRHEECSQHRAEKHEAVIRLYINNIILVLLHYTGRNNWIGLYFSNNSTNNKTTHF